MSRRGNVLRRVRGRLQQRGCPGVSNDVYVHHAVALPDAHDHRLTSPSPFSDTDGSGLGRLDER